MVDREDVTLWTAVRRSPVRTGVFVGLPLLLAVGQLLNALVTGFPLWVAVAFAAVMVAYAAMYVRLHHSRVRLHVLEHGAAT